jgi:DNA (cytosine-5)-methyltransferase 1
LFGIDIDPSAVATFALNFGKDVARQDDLLQCSPQIYLHELGLKRGELDHLHASPPCEAYSCNNRVRKNLADIRFRPVLDWVEAFLPKVMTIENVHNMEKAHDKEIRARLEALGYEVICFKVDAADYGVPQHRKRLFYLACLDLLGVNPRIPEAPHCDPSKSANGLRKWVTVREAIGDLPPREAGTGPERFKSHIDLSDPAKRMKLSEYATTMRPAKGSSITGHYARPFSELSMCRVRSLKAGQAIFDLPLHLRPRSGFRGAYGRLYPDRPAKTVTTGVHGPSHGPFCHYAQDRLITLREAARLQSFPDSFLFQGGIQAQATLIGNAVPPLLSKAIRLASERILNNAI